MKRNKEMKQFYIPKCNILCIPKDEPESEEYRFSNDQDVHVVVYIQNRKHPKKRIKKKWFKRYGYTEEERIVKGWQANVFVDAVDMYYRKQYLRIWNELNEKYLRKISGRKH